MNEDIKPCPFCGGKPDLYTVPLKTKYEGYHNYTKAQCKTCKAQTNVYYFENDAIEAWNRRYKDYG